MQAVEMTKEELASEVAHLRQRVAELEASERELKQVDEALKRNEQEKAVLFDSISEHVVYQDTRMRVLWTNRAAGESVGIDPRQLVGRHCYEIWQQRSKPCVGCPVVKARKSGQPQEAEMISPDGRVWFIRGYSVRDIKGNTIGAVEVTLEITESKKVEEALRKSEERYRTVIELSPDGIAVASKGRHVFANKSLAKIFGVSDPNELLGKSLLDYIHPDYRKIVKERLDRQTKRGELVPLIEEKMLRADGTVIHTEVAAAPLKYEGEQAVLAVIRDITERKKAEEELRQNEERYKFLFENSQTVNILIGTDGKIIDINESAAQSLGFKKKNILGKEVIDFVIPEQRKEVVQQLSLELNGKYTPPLEIDIITNQGTRFSLQRDMQRSLKRVS
jgi:PAS domain S-box-containing protein